MMWKSGQMVRVLARGGILTPSYMLNILSVVRSTGHKYVNFGSRQDLLFQVSPGQMQSVRKAFASIRTDYIIHERKGSNAQNIVSSYVASDITTSTPWLSSGNYLYALENFNFQPTLRINITDPQQGLVPLFYGNLNFIASTIKDYWYLYIRRNDSALPERWPVLVFSGEIGNLSKVLEQNWHILLKSSINDLFERIQIHLNYNWRKAEIPFQLEFIPPQDYEGFGRMYNSNNYWAGFYWRNNKYDASFLEELCTLCLRTGIAKICLTPWKSILVKELQEKDLLQWHHLLGRFGINMRHSSFELNWHLPLKDKLALRLKRFIVRKFDKVDVSVHGLTFGIKTKPEPSFCTIQIERISGIPWLKRFDLFAAYNISYAKQFNANTCEYHIYMLQVPRYRVPEELQNLTLMFYAQFLKEKEKNPKEPKIEQEDTHTVYQCQQCLSIYDEKSGDASGAIISFDSLPETFTCPLCEAPKADFRPLLMSKLMKGINA